MTNEEKQLIQENGLLAELAYLKLENKPEGWTVRQFMEGYDEPAAQSLTGDKEKLSEDEISDITGIKPYRKNKMEAVLDKYDIIDFESDLSYAPGTNYTVGTDFQGMFVRNKETGKYSILFRGTDSLEDIVVDAGMTLNQNDQIEKALEFTKSMMEKYNVKKEDITITGHSLGGINAQMAGAILGIKSYSYNPLGSSEMVEKYISDNPQLGLTYEEVSNWAEENMITVSYNDYGTVNGDILSNSASLLASDGHLGKKINLYGPNVGILDGHSIMTTNDTIENYSDEKQDLVKDVIRVSSDLSSRYYHFIMSGEGNLTEEELEKINAIKAAIQNGVPPVHIKYLMSGFPVSSNVFISRLSVATEKALSYKEKMGNDFDFGELAKDFFSLDKKLIEGLASRLNFGDPIVLDLNGDGKINTTTVENGVYFDIDKDGFKEQTAWISADDGILVDGNQVKNVDDLFGDDVNSGFDELRTLDSNEDGLFTAADKRFNEINVWQDYTQDGIVQDFELKKLDLLGITEIDLFHYQQRRYTDENGNRIEYNSTFVQNEERKYAADLDLGFSSIDTIHDFENTDVSNEQYLLKGLGEVKNLEYVLATDPDFKIWYEENMTGSPDSVLINMEEFLKRWAQIPIESEIINNDSLSEKLWLIDTFAGVDSVKSYIEENSFNNEASRIKAMPNTRAIVSADNQIKKIIDNYFSQIIFQNMSEENSYGLKVDSSLNRIVVSDHFKLYSDLIEQINKGNLVDTSFILALLSKAEILERLNMDLLRETITNTRVLSLLEEGVTEFYSVLDKKHNEDGSLTYESLTTADELNKKGFVYLNNEILDAERIHNQEWIFLEGNNELHAHNTESMIIDTIGGENFIDTRSSGKLMVSTYNSINEYHSFYASEDAEYNIHKGTYAGKLKARNLKVNLNETSSLGIVSMEGEEILDLDINKGTHGLSIRGSKNLFFDVKDAVIEKLYLRKISEKAVLNLTNTMADIKSRWGMENLVLTTDREIDFQANAFYHWSNYVELNTSIENDNLYFRKYKTAIVNDLGGENSFKMYYVESGTIAAGNGNDTYNVGSVDDLIITDSGGSNSFQMQSKGVSSLSFGDGNDDYKIHYSKDVSIKDSGGNNTFNSHTNKDGLISLDIGDGEDSYTFGNTDNLTIRDAGGDNVIELDEVVRTSIESGSGNDNVTATELTDFSMFDSGGNNHIDVSGESKEESFFAETFTAEGNDFVSIKEFSVASISDTGGDNTLVAKNINDVMLSSGKGRDYIKVNNSQNVNISDQGGDFNNLMIWSAENVDVQTGAGTDFVYVGGATNVTTFDGGGDFNDLNFIDVDNLNLQTGEGEDVIHFFGKSANITSGAGNDSIRTFSDAGAVEIDAGEGDDMIETGSLFDSNTVLKFSKGHGVDDIVSLGGNEIIEFSGIIKEDISVFMEYGDLYVDTGDSNLIRINSQEDEYRQVEKFELEDGSYMTSDDVNKLIQDINAFATDNGLEIGSAADVKKNQDLMNIVTSSWRNVP